MNKGKKNVIVTQGLKILARGNSHRPTKEICVSARKKPVVKRAHKSQTQFTHMEVKTIKLT